MNRKDNLGEPAVRAMAGGDVDYGQPWHSLSNPKAGEHKKKRSEMKEISFCLGYGDKR